MSFRRGPKVDPCGTPATISSKVAKWAINAYSLRSNFQVTKWDD